MKFFSVAVLIYMLFSSKSSLWRKNDGPHIHRLRLPLKPDCITCKWMFPFKLKCFLSNFHWCVCVKIISLPFCIVKLHADNDRNKPFSLNNPHLLHQAFHTFVHYFRCALHHTIAFPFPQQIQSYFLTQINWKRFLQFLQFCYSFL